MMRDMREFFFTGLLGCLLITVCCFNVYELLRQAWKHLPGMKSHPRMRVLMIMSCIFVVHIVNIWIFGITYYLLHTHNMGTLNGSSVEQGQYAIDFFGCLYFSAVNYSTLGLGDITPTGALRMITGVEALTGFIMIGWTVSFTYLAMEKFWPLPHRRNEKNR